MSSVDKPEPSAKPAPASSLQNKKPWPMWPFALAILIFIPVYTFLNLEYRKEEKPYEAWQAMQDRMNAIVEKNIYDWYSLKTLRSESPVEIADPASMTVSFDDDMLEKTVPEQLKYYMLTRPVLVPGKVKIEAPTSLTPGENLPVRVFVPAGLANDDRLHLLSFYKEGELFVLAVIFVEEIEEAADALTGEATPVDFSIPTTPMAAHSVKGRFLSDGRLAEWSMENLAPEKAKEDVE